MVFVDGRNCDRDWDFCFIITSLRFLEWSGSTCDNGRVFRESVDASVSCDSAIGFFFVRRSEFKNWQLNDFLSKRAVEIFFREKSAAVVDCERFAAAFARTAFEVEELQGTSMYSNDVSCSPLISFFILLPTVSFLAHSFLLLSVFSTRSFPDEFFLFMEGLVVGALEEVEGDCLMSS